MRKTARTLLVPGVIVLLGLFAASFLGTWIGRMEHEEFEAVADQLIGDVTDGYTDLGALVRMYGAATALGVSPADLQATSGIAPARIAGSISALAVVPDEGDPTVLAFRPLEADVIRQASTHELTPVAGDRYLMTLPMGSSEARAVFSMETLVGTIASHSEPLISLELLDGDHVVHALNSDRTDFTTEREIQLGDRVFTARLVAGPAYSASGARAASSTTIGFAIALAALALKLRTTVAARIRAEAERAEMAEEINAGKDRFLASVAHELRTPLSVIMGTTMELLGNRDHHSEAEQREMLEMAAHESVSIRDTIEDMLITARLEAGDLAITRRRTDLVELAENHVSTLDVPPNIRVVVENSRIGEVVVDPGRWVHAFRNLVSNAIDHADTRVEVTFAQAGPNTIVVVEDDGPGLPADLIEHAFRPYAALATIATSPAPVGVGLSVSRGLARKLGGDVTYRRTGTTSMFMLVVPTNPEEIGYQPGFAVVPSIAS